MAITQYLVSTMVITNPVGDQPGDPMLGRWVNGNATPSIAEMPTAGVFSNLRIRLETAPGAGTSRTFALSINGVSTALSVTIADTATDAQSTASVSVALGDTVSILCSRVGTPAFSTGHMGLEFTSTQGSTGIYGSNGNPPNNFTRYGSPLFGDEGAGTVSEVTAASLVAVAGSITHWRVRLTVAPGVGKNWTLTLYKNGVAQNGSGGTVDTRIVVSDLATTGSSSTSLTLAAGDLVSVEYLPSGTPANIRMAISTAFRSNGTTLPFGMQSIENNNTVDRYHYLTTSVIGGGVVDWSATDVLRDDGGVNRFELSLMGVYLPAPCGAGASRTFTLLDNGVATSQTVTISGVSQQYATCVAAGVAIEPGSIGRYSILQHPSGSPSVNANAKIVFGAQFLSPVGSTQVLYSSGAIAGTGTFYFNPLCPVLNGQTEAENECPISTAGTIRNLQIHLNDSVTITSKTFVLRKNNADTAITVTFLTGDTDKSDLIHSITVVAGDILSLKETVAGGNQNTVGQIRIGFEPTAAQATIYGFGTGLQLSEFADNFRSIIGGSSAQNTISDAVTTSVIGTPGTLTNWYLKITTAPAATKSWTAVLTKNGTVQDGTGGTANTTITFTNATATLLSATFSLAIVEGDYIGVKVTDVNNPAGVSMRGCTTFVATTEGERHINCNSSFALSGTSTQYNTPHGGDVQWTTDPLAVMHRGAVQGLVVGGLHAELSAAVGAAKSYTFTLVLNGSDTGQTVTIEGASQTSATSTAANVLIADGDTWVLKAVPSGVALPTPTVKLAFYFTGETPTPPDDVPVATIAGVLTRIRRHTLTISEVLNGRNTLSCQVISTDGTYRPATDSEVVVYLNSLRIFAGTVGQTTEVGIVGGYSVPIFTRVAVNDFNSLADRRYLNLTLAAGTLKSMLTTLVTYLSAYGVTLDAAQVTGPSLDALTYDYRQLTEILNDLAALSGYVWEIDYDKHLRMYSPGTVSAPFNVVDGDRNAIGDIQVDQTSNTSYANRIVLRAGSGLAQETDTFTGDGSTYSFPLTYPFSSAGQWVSNNGAQESFTLQGIGFDLAVQWLYYSVDNTIRRETSGTPDAPANGNTITFSYVAQFPITLIAEDTADQALHGIIERMVEKPDVFDITVAQALADAELAAALAKPNTVRYRTRRIGLKPGQTQTITAATRAINDTYLVTDIQASDSGDELGTLVRDVTATQGTTLKSTWRETYKRWSGISGASAPVA